MLAEGKITPEECDELLEALADRREAPRPDDAVRIDTGKRAKWPYVLLILLCVPAVLAILSLIAGITIPAFRRTGFRLVPFAMTLPLSAIGLIAFVFWIWMIVDCLGREPYDFRLLFTQKREHDKWIWLAIVILTHWIGALIYFILIRQPARSIRPLAETPVARRAGAPPADSDYVPPKRAWSLLWLVVLCVIGVLIVIPLLGLLRLHIVAAPHRASHLTWALLVAPAAIAVIALPLFWLSMLISCLARDYRDFGTIIPNDPAADKMVWLLIVLFLPIIGAIAYHISIRRRVRVQPCT